MRNSILVLLFFCSILKSFGNELFANDYNEAGDDSDWTKLMNLTAQVFQLYSNDLVRKDDLKPNLLVQLTETHWDARLRFELFLLSKNKISRVRPPNCFRFCNESSYAESFEYQLIAKRVFNLTLDLSTARRMDKLVAKATVAALDTKVRDTIFRHNSFFDNLFHDWLLKIRASIQNDSFLQSRYTSLRVTPNVNLTKFVGPSAILTDIDLHSDGDFIDLLKWFISKFLTMQTLGRRCSCQNMTNEDRKRNLFGRALIEVAENYSDDSINSDITDMVNELAEEITNISNAMDYEDGLFRALDQVLGEEKYSRLKTELDYVREYFLNEDTCTDAEKEFWTSVTKL